jgi:hypothetical protein
MGIQLKGTQQLIWTTFTIISLIFLAREENFFLYMPVYLPLNPTWYSVRFLLKGWQILKAQQVFSIMRLIQPSEFLYVKKENPV